ncbi:MAG TPA: hypothetical protein VGM45_08780 [Gaiellaceae bacterium]|jgi:hypothetical protein
MQPDPVLTLLSGALAAALIGLLGAWIQSRREHFRWVREQRLSAYLAYARETERILTKPYRGAPEDAERAQAATAALRLLGPTAVFDAAFAFTVSSMRYALLQREPDANPGAEGQAYLDLSTARQTFIEAARQELRIRG